MSFKIRKIISEVTPSQIKQAFKEYYPEFEADIEINDKFITGVIYTEQKRFLEFYTAQREVGDFVERAVGYNGYVAFFNFSKDRQRHKEALVNSIVRPKLNSLSRTYHVDVDVRINVHAVNITVKSWCFRNNRNSKETARSIVFAIEDEILKLSECKSLYVYTDECRESFQPNFAILDDDFDDDPGNPNWPSKTGRPSGGGRGNNPPK